jgi:TusE/DsrC/DsvC family sulfur relay protein
MHFHVPLEGKMQSFDFQGRVYQVDGEGFLLDPEQWDENFARGMASHVGIPGGLSIYNWRVISFIRNSFSETARCPMVHEMCRALDLRLADLKQLFPSGYLRGACKLAGLTYKEEEVHSSWLPKREPAKAAKLVGERVYRIDIRGFLIDPAEWDEEYALYRAREMKMVEDLTPKHWEIIGFLREHFDRNGKVPTVYETCESIKIEIDELERFFPDGYHRGAVKIAGLRVR